MPNRPRRSVRGFTLLEVFIATGLSAIIVMLATGAIIQVDRTQFVRQNVTDLQGGTRLALGWLEQDLRQASLSVGSGVIWTSSGANPVGRPAIQIYASAPGGGFLNVMPNTDALLVVSAVPSIAAQPTAVPRTVTAAALVDSRLPIPVTDASQFAQGNQVLLGDYGDASWGVISTPPVTGSVQSISLGNTGANVFPAQQTKQLGGGASVRLAQSRLYYVDTRNELVRLTLAAPTAPAQATGYTREVLAQGVENMTVGCLLDDGNGGFTSCPAPLSGDPGPSDPLFTEAQAALGNFGNQQGPRLTTALTSPARVMLLRNVVVNLSVRSRLPVDLSESDPVVAGTLPAGATPPSGNYVRRAYQLNVAIRNTSLGVF